MERNGHELNVRKTKALSRPRYAKAIAAIDPMLIIAHDELNVHCSPAK